MGMTQLVRICQDWHHGTNSATFWLQERKHIRGIEHAKKVIGELLTDVGYLESKIKSMRTKPKTDERDLKIQYMRVDLKDLVDAIQFIEINFGPPKVSHAKRTDTSTTNTDIR